MSTDEDKNMELWESVCETDPKYTKPVKIGAREFTAIEPQYQIREATRKWGPYGGNWGVKNCEYWGITRPTKTTKNDANTSVGDVIEVTLDAVFYYPGGEFEISTCLGYRPNNDTRKKLLTDLTTKALSKLGFNADVFMGRFDGNKYINDKPQSPPSASQEIDDEIGPHL